MPAPQTYINAQAPMGANLTLTGDGATFRVWAREAKSVYNSGSFNAWSQNDQSLLVKEANGDWAGFVPGVKAGDTYKFYVVGNDPTPGYKRDPYARDLST
jgi:1,4-alpha-glucan branching enzyme